MDSGDAGSESSAPGCSSRSISTPSPSFKRPRSKADQVLEKIAKRIDNHTQNTSSAEKKKETHDAFGEYVAEKLRSLPKEMACYCQKMINDAIFLAETNTLSVTSRIVNDPVPVTPAVLQQPALTPSTSNSSNPVMEAYLDAVNSIQQYDYE